MPIYEYQCTHCGHKFEKLQKISDEPIKNCSYCHKDTASKIISAAGFRLKGSGWYETDFKSNKDLKRNLAAESSKDTSKADTKSTSTDSSSTPVAAAANSSTANSTSSSNKNSGKSTNDK